MRNLPAGGGELLFIIWIMSVSMMMSCGQEPEPEAVSTPPPSFTPPPLGLVPVPDPSDTLLHVVMGVMEGFYAISVDDSIVGVVESLIEDEGALLFSIGDRGRTEVARIGELQTFVIHVPPEFAGQTLVVQTSNMSPCDSDPYTMEAHVIPPDGMVYVDVSPERIPFMDFYVTGFIMEHGQYWRLSRTF